MELFVAIALLCQANTGGSIVKNNRTYESHLMCQQNFIHCINIKNTMTKQDALEKCIMEKK